MIPFKLRLIREQNRIYSKALSFLRKMHKGLEVYLFHDILDNKADVKTQFAISQESFELFLLSQLHIGKKAYTFSELSDIILSNKKDENGFYVTFDDCNTSVYTKAYPFLKNHQIPFVLFITQELIGKKNFLTIEQIVEMAKDQLCTIGSHAVHHKMFRYMPEAEAKREFKESRQYLQQLTGQSVDCFAFPYGRLVEVSCANIKILKQIDYQFAFSAIVGNLSQKWLSGKFYLPRINVSEELVSNQLKQFK